MKNLSDKIKDLMDKLDFDVKISDDAIQLLKELEEVSILDKLLVMRLIHEYLNHFPLIDNDLNGVEEQFFFYKVLNRLKFENMMERKTKAYIEERIEKNWSELDDILAVLENKINAQTLLEREYEQVKLNHLINKRLTRD